MDRGLSSWLARLALLVGSLVLVAALGELWLRATWAEPVRTSHLTAEQRESLPVLRTLKDLTRPNVLGQHRGVLYRTNSRSLRGPEYARRAARGTRRIGVAGDSVTVGWGVDEDDAYPAQAERRLRAAGEGAEWEVINLGLAGLAAGRIMGRLERKDAFYDFDVVVYGFTVNDLESEHYERRHAAGEPMQRARRNLRALDSPSYLWRYLWPRLLSLRNRLSSDETSVADEVLYNLFENEAAREALAEALDHLAALTTTRGRCGLVLLHTHLTELGPLHPYLPVYETVGAAAEARGLTVVPTFETFRGRYEPHLWVAFFDPHPNADGHALYGELLADALLALPERCWARANARQAE